MQPSILLVQMNCMFMFQTVQQSADLKVVKIWIHSSTAIRPSTSNFKRLCKKNYKKIFPFQHCISKVSPLTGRHDFCSGWWSLQVGLLDNWVSIHAVLLHCQVVCAATSSLVGTGHNPEPTALALQWGGELISNYSDHPLTVTASSFSNKSVKHSAATAFQLLKQPSKSG